MRDEPQGAKSKASLDGLPVFATRRIACTITPHWVLNQNGPFAHQTPCVCVQHTQRGLGGQIIPFWIRTRMTEVLETILNRGCTGFDVGSGTQQGMS
ncbi:MAG: hypothetical protein ACO24Y_10620, partial [Hylemonella sp.]